MITWSNPLKWMNCWLGFAPYSAGRLLTGSKSWNLKTLFWTAERIAQTLLHDAGDHYALQRGDHVFELIMSMSADAAHAHSGEEEPDRLLCRLHAGTWPGDSLPFEAAWVEVSGRLLPARLALPAGRPVSLFLGASAKARRERIPAQDQLLQVKPAEVTLTEFARPRGGRTEIPLPPGQPAVLDVR